MIDQNGSHFVLPVQAKGHRDRIEIVQIEQDFALGKERFSDLICRPGRALVAVLLAIFGAND